MVLSEDCPVFNRVASEKRLQIPAAVIFQLLVVAASFAYAFHMQGLLPETVPTHHGKLLSHTDTANVVWILPSVEVFLLLTNVGILFTLPAEMRARKMGSYVTIPLLLATVVLALLHIRTLQATLTSVQSPATSLGGRRLPPNPISGVRPAPGEIA
jgi:hypothetical protein